MALLKLSSTDGRFLVLDLSEVLAVYFIENGIRIDAKNGSWRIVRHRPSKPVLDLIGEATEREKVFFECIRDALTILWDTKEKVSKE